MPDQSNQAFTGVPSSAATTAQADGLTTSSVLSTTSVAPLTTSSSAEIAATSSLPSGTSHTGSTAAAATSAASTSNTSQASNGVSTGVVAGAAIGAALGGALIAALITWLFMRKREKRRTARHKHGRPEMVNNVDRSSRKETNAVAVAGARGWESHLPQPIDENTLKFKAKTLFHQIELHVENFYSDVHPQIPQDVSAQLSEFNSTDLPGPVPALIQSTKRPTVVIKYCLTRYIVSQISLSDGAQASFLPSECTRPATKAMRAMAANERPGIEQAFSRWRVLTAYLLLGSNNNGEETAANQNRAIDPAAAHLSALFAPWSNGSQSDIVHGENLAAIMRSAAQLGQIIFSQPSEFFYSWAAVNRQANNNRQIVVTPTLLKVTDENAKPLEPPVVVVTPVTAQL